MQLMINALVAGVLSPLLSGSALHLALGSAAFVLAGWLMWCWKWRASWRRGGPA
jgi:MFS transporter, DHA1 family, multidrug resistance protein